jgi:hypothetical protein
MSKNRIIHIVLFAVFIFGMSAQEGLAQQAKWMGIGSLQNFYMPVGTEREHALVAQQQYGLRWPALYDHQDSQAAKGFWIGTTNFTDVSNTSYPYKVIHAGPRAGGLGSFFSMEHKLIGRFPKVDVLVNDEETFNVADAVDEVDPTIPSDRMIYSRINTAVGITIERKIMAFSNEFHDNYHIREYVFTNTGKADVSDQVIYPNKTLTDVMFFWQERYSVLHQTRYVIGNATGWGINAMVDRFGDGRGPDYGADEGLRGHFVWHGKMPAFTQYDNIGAPIWTASTSSGLVLPQDTIGRLGAHQFVGNAVLHADSSPSNSADDRNQPFTMTEVGSDDGLNSSNDPFNNAKMEREYNEFMMRGRTDRHAYLVEPSGEAGFLNPSGDPSRGTSGGFSSAKGFGPYTLAPGESIRIVFVEGVAGLSREAAVRIGEAYKRSGGNNTQTIAYNDGNRVNASLTKNQWVFTSRDSLMQTFNRAKANFDSDFGIPKPPVPPTSFRVNSGGDGVYMEWDYPSGAAGSISGFEIYRAQFRRDSVYTKIATLPASAREFADTDANPAGGPVRGLDHYYYIQAVGNASDNTGAGLTPTGPLRSNRYLTQTYDPARLLRPPGTSMDQITIVPNPFVRSASTDVSYAGFEIQFFEVPGRARIDIYTELGELVQTINHTNGSGDASWNLNTKWRQRVVSGVYIAIIENLDTGEKTTRKFVVIM